MAGTTPQGPGAPAAPPAGVAVVSPGGTTPGTAPAVSIGAVKRPYRRRLRHLGNVRTALADAVRGLESGAMDPNRGRALVYALSTLAAVISEGDIEKRLTALEARALGRVA